MMMDDCQRRAVALSHDFGSGHRAVGIARHHHIDAGKRHSTHTAGNVDIAHLNRLGRRTWDAHSLFSP